MKRPVIKRYFSEAVFESIKADFGFLIEKIIQSGFEYDLQIRDDSFNLYYKGNSLAMVAPKPSRGTYAVRIHTKFFSNTSAEKDCRFHPQKKDSYIYLNITNGLLHPLFQSKYISEFSSNIKKVGFQEETTFEQMLMTDNIGRSDLIIIDRQVVDTVDRTKMDMLALVKKQNNDYQFCIIEVKLGNNQELKGKVFQQLADYVDKVKKYFDDYKECYEKNLKQKQELGLIDKKLKVDIVKGVSGVVVVVGYSGIARSSIRRLKEKAPNIKVLQLKNTIDLSKAI